MGKWGLGPPGSEGDPLRQGFDHFFGYNCQRQAHGYYPTYLYDDARRIPLDNPDRSPHQKLARQRRSARPAELRGLLRQRLRARPDLGARPWFRPREQGPPVLPLPADDRAAPRPLRCPRTRSPSTGACGPIRRTAATRATCRTPRRAPPTRRWSRGWTARSGGSSTSCASWSSSERTIVVFTSDNGPTYDRIGGVGLGVLPLGRRAAGAERLALRGRRARPGDRELEGPGRDRRRERPRYGLRGLAAHPARARRGESRRSARDRRRELRADAARRARNNRVRPSTASSRATAGSRRSASATGRACARDSASPAPHASSSTT